MRKFWKRNKKVAKTETVTTTETTEHKTEVQRTNCVIHYTKGTVGTSSIGVTAHDAKQTLKLFKDVDEYVRSNRQ